MFTWIYKTCSQLSILNVKYMGSCDDFNFKSNYLIRFVYIYQEDSIS